MTHLHFVYRKRIYLLATLLALVGAFIALRPQTALAHPLGNFTINQFSRIVIGQDQLSLYYVLDLAEIPTFQEVSRIDLNGDDVLNDEERSAYLSQMAQELAQRLYVSVNESPIPLAISDQQMSFSPGQGGLRILRMELLFKGAMPKTGDSEAQDLYYRNDNYTQRVGWKEIIVQAGQGVSLNESTVPQLDRSDELRSYPDDFLNSPPNQLEARSTFVLGSVGQSQRVSPTPKLTEPTSKSGDIFASLLAKESLSLSVILISIMAAMGLGALHALSPGHGKTVMAAYLVGTKGTAIHALFLGLTVTVSHTVGVLILALVVLHASNVIAPEQLYPWLSLGSGVIILSIGAWLIASRLRGNQNTHHHHDHPHSHIPGQNERAFGITWKSLTALGIAGGVVPSASALIILLAAISLHRVGLGLLLIIAFSAGMAFVLSGVGIILVFAGRSLEGISGKISVAQSLPKLLPWATALVVLASGLVIVLRASLQMGLV